MEAQAQAGTTETQPEGGLPGARLPAARPRTARRSDAPRLQRRRLLATSHTGRRGTPSAVPPLPGCVSASPPSFLLLQSRRARVPRTSSSAPSSPSSSSLGLLPSDRPGSSRTKTQTLWVQRRNCFRRLRHVAARSKERREVTSATAPSPPKWPPKGRGWSHVALSIKRSTPPLPAKGAWPRPR